MRRLICCLLLYLAAPLALAALDLNTATEAELDALPGVGPSRAQAIIEHRAKSGPFRSVDDLRAVKGIGDKTFAELKPLLTVGAASGARTSARTEPSPVSPAAVPTPASGGFPWWIVAVVAIAAAATFVLMRKRGIPEAAQPVAVPPAPHAPTQASMPKQVAPAPQSVAPPRPASAAATRPVPPGPSGAPPRPAGSAPVAASLDDASTHAPKPPGAPPKPAGSR